MGVFVRRQLPRTGDRHGLRTDQREEPALQRALVQLHVIADAKPMQQVEELLEGDPLSVEQQLIAGVEDAQVAEHLALLGEKGGVAARSTHQHLDVVADLALEKCLGLRSA